MWWGLTDFGVQEALKGSCECLLTLLELGALHAHEGLADEEALSVGSEAEEAGPGRCPKDCEGHHGARDSTCWSQRGHCKGSWAGKKLVTFVRSS